jgi:ribose/xylose/arabinose/galactoside ABC-type transport system permease subunit
MARSKFGRKIYCIGANQEAAKLSGINIQKVKFITYLISGIAASISGLILTGQSAVGMPQHATGSELDVITAVLLGGTSLAGGKGSVLGTLAGVLILGVLYNGFTMIGFRYVHIRVFQGAILILVVSLYEVREKKSY